MKKLLYVLLFAPLALFGQYTYVPDNAFEQILINTGLDDEMDDFVLTSNIDTVSILTLCYYGIQDITGIEDFTALSYLDISHNIIEEVNFSQNTLLTELICTNNNITSLNISQNVLLTRLECNQNDLSEIDVSLNILLNYLDLSGNQLPEINISQNTALTYLELGGNAITNIDVSVNSALTFLHCEYNQLNSLDLINNNNLIILHCGGNQLLELNLSYNSLLSEVNCSYNPQLNCIEVSDIEYAETNQNFIKDTNAIWSLDCGAEVSIEEIAKHNFVIKTIDIFGREVFNEPFTLLIDLYDDGSTQRRVVIE